MLDTTIAVSNFINSIPEESIAFYTQLVFDLLDNSHKDNSIGSASLSAPSLKNDAISQYIYLILANNKFPKELFVNDSLSEIEQQHKFINLVSVCDSCFLNFKKRFDTSTLMIASSSASFKEYLRLAIGYYIIGYIIIIYYIPNSLALLSSKTITNINNDNEKESSLEIFTRLILLYKQEFSLNTIRSQVEDFINKHKKKKLLSDPKYIPTIKKRKSTKSYLTDYGPDYYDEENANNKNPQNKNNQSHNAIATLEEDLEFFPDNTLNSISGNTNNSISLISCKHLQKLLENKKKKIALVDLRSSEQFNKNHISNKFLINLDPQLFQKMKSADELERSLRQSLKIKASVNTEPGEVTINLDAFDDDPDFIQLKKSYNYFKQRHKFSYIVIYTDEKTWSKFNNTDSSYNFVQHFYDLIYSIVSPDIDHEGEADPEKKFKKLDKKPRVLDGGFESWLTFLETQNENVYNVNNSNHNGLYSDVLKQNNNSNHDSAILNNVKKSSNNSSTINNIGQNDYYNSNYNPYSELNDQSNVKDNPNYKFSSKDNENNPIQNPFHGAPSSIPSYLQVLQPMQYLDAISPNYSSHGEKQQSLKLNTSGVHSKYATNSRENTDVPPPVPGKSPINTIKPKVPTNNIKKKPPNIPSTLTSQATSFPPALSQSGYASHLQPQQRKRKSPLNSNFDKSFNSSHGYNQTQQVHKASNSHSHHHRRGASNNNNLGNNDSNDDDNVNDMQFSNLSPYQAFLLKDAPRPPQSISTPVSSSLSPKSINNSSGMPLTNKISINGNSNNMSHNTGTVIAPEPPSVVKVPPLPITYNSVVRAPPLRPPQLTNLIIKGEIKPPPIPNTANISNGSGHNGSSNSNTKDLHSRGHSKSHSQSQDAGLTKNPLQILSIVGLKNSGNTCYINSLIQCIFVIPEFRNVFVSSEYREFSLTDNGISQLQLRNSGPMISASICTLFNKMRDYGGVIISPSNFLSKCNRMRPDFQIPNLQQDTAEFLIFLLDSLHEEMNKNFKLMAERYPICVNPALDFRDFTTFDTASRLSINVTDREIKDYSKWFKAILEKNGISPISLLFQGQMESCLRCVKCSNISKSFSIFSVLSLPIIEKTSLKKKIRLEDCIKLFTADEVLSGDNAWDCPNCKKKESKLKEINEKLRLENEMHQKEANIENNLSGNKKFFDFKKKKKPNVEKNGSPGSNFESEESNATSRLEKFKSLQITGTKTIKSLKFLQLPEILVINVSRFSFNKYGEVTSKNNSNIIFPIVLDIKVKEVVLTYKLFAFINHYGNLKSGHYTSVVNKSNNLYKDIWCYFDDENFKFNINPGINFADKTISSSDVYVMFYQKVKSII